MSPSADFGAEREQGDGLSTPKSHNRPRVHSAVELSPAQQEDLFGVWPKWTQFRWLLPVALLGWWLLGIFAGWLNAHPSSAMQWSWASYTNVTQILVSTLDFALFLLASCLSYAASVHGGRRGAESSSSLQPRSATSSACNPGSGPTSGVGITHP